MATQIIERLDGSRVKAKYITHRRTLTGSMGRDNDDVDLFCLADGTEIECISPSNDCRVTPREINDHADNYPGHPPGR